MATIKFKPGGDIAFGNDRRCSIEQICIYASNIKLSLSDVNSSSTHNRTIITDPPISPLKILNQIDELKKDGFEYITLYGNPETIGELGHHLVSETTPAVKEEL